MTTASLPPTSPRSPRPTDPYARRPGSHSLSHAPSSPRALSSTPRPAASRHGVPSEPTHAASPNYFNLTIDSSKSCQSSAGGAYTRANWSPPSSRVRSAAAASPRIIPVDQNPEYAAFKRQSEIAGPANLNFTLSRLGAADENVDGRPPASPSAHAQNTPCAAIAAAAANGVGQAKAASPKRPLSSPYTNTSRHRRLSPPGFSDTDSSNATHGLQSISDEPMQISLPGSSTASPQSPLTPRAETLPANFPRIDYSGMPFASPEDVATILSSENADVLLLDMRVSTLYARSRIQGALNLCIPTTLLKRPTYDTNRLAATFESPEQRSKFEGWPNYRYVIVYDGSSSPRNDASSCENLLKKFNKAGWQGSSYIISGGFNEFSKQFPSLVQHGAASSGGAHAPSGVAPVIGGCPLPATESAAIPFFSNIRQNMDLMDGVGRMPVKRPRYFSGSPAETLPKWLRLASDENDDGKAVSDKFLAIEQQEKKRMEKALLERVVYGAPTDVSANSVRIAGIEKGDKNRYNSIWPYEHSRVKLGGELRNDCDYVNASFIKAAGTNKRYIATQCPLPETFNDFWNVVWQQDVRVIVMLTAETEGGQLKGHNYWNKKRYGSMHLNFLSEHRASLEPAKIHRRRDRLPSTSNSHGHGRPNPRSPNVRSPNARPSEFGGRTPRSPNVQREPGAKAPRGEAPAASGDQHQPYVTVRTFTLSCDDRPFEPLREITQLHYAGWPDFGAPADPAHLLGLVEQCDIVVRAGQTVPAAPPPAVARSRSSTSGDAAPSPAELLAAAAPAPRNARPVIVHCSAGCGRTGTFCTVDSVVDMLKRLRRRRAAQSPRSPQSDAPPPGEELRDEDWDEVDLVERAVRDFRGQRLSMVQNLRQFVLCYESVLEWLAAQTPLST